MEKLSDIIGTIPQGSQKTGLISSPAGFLPEKYWRRIMESLNYSELKAYPEFKDYVVFCDTEEEKSKYSDMLGVENTKRPTALKNFVESKIFAAYRNLYDLNTACENYLAKKNPALSKKVIQELLEEIMDDRRAKEKRPSKKVSQDAKNFGI